MSVVWFAVGEHLSAQHSAIKMLHSRVKLVLEYLRAVQAGKLPSNHEVLRQAYSLSHRLPVVQTSHFHQDFYNVSSENGILLTIIFLACQGPVPHGCKCSSTFGRLATPSQNFYHFGTHWANFPVISVISLIKVFWCLNVCF